MEADTYNLFTCIEVFDVTVVPDQYLLSLLDLAMGGEPPYATKLAVVVKMG